ncbi:MAG TPA: type IV pilus biogenesis/stability protein PilW [Steroidobacteraceae bacterium]|jgi:type IV pilus assembly protein PilF|nr:type IV pilus biogenesis/stability protein PilW [Steroidobacteraceae bacterium]
MTAEPMRVRIAAAALLATLAACGSMPQQHPESANEEAAGYNVQLGIGYLQKGDLAIAKEKLERAERESPRSPKVHSALGLLYERLGDPKRADDEYRTSLRYAPQDPEVANNYAVFLCKSARTEEGVKYFLEAAHNPLYRTPEAAYTNVAVCLRAAHRDDEAKQNLQHALAIRPNFAEAAYQLADLEFERGHLNDARTVLTHYTDSFDATPELLLLGVRIARAMGDRVAAEHYARSLRMDFPSSEQARALSDLNRNSGS